MTTNTSNLVITVSATHRSAIKEASAHLSRGESQATIQAGILDLSVRISRWAAFLDASSSDQAHGPEDLAALGWIQGSLEDVEATIIGLMEANRRRSAASGGPAAFAGSLLPWVPPGPVGSLDHRSG